MLLEIIVQLLNDQEGDDFGEEIEAALLSREFVALLVPTVGLATSCFRITLHQLRESQPLRE